MAKPKSLTVAEVKKVRALKKKGLTIADLVRKTKVGKSVIFDALHKRGAYASV